MDIIVLAGGLSTERDVSFRTGDMVANALRGRGHRVILLDVFMGYGERECELLDVFDRADEITLHCDSIPEKAPDLAAVRASRADKSPSFFGPNVLQMCQKADVVFMALHGENGENGKVQATFDLFGIRYTGSDYLSSAIAMNKLTAKTIMASVGVPVPQGISMKKAHRCDDISILGISLPCIVKPVCGGSSIGVSIVREAKDFAGALDEGFFWEDELVIEQFIEGREFSVGVLDGEALPVIEIAPKVGFYDYKNKYKAGSAVETCPANIPQEISALMQGYAKKVARAIGLTVYSRMDMLLDKNNNIYVMEANTLPGMTPTSLLPQEAAVIGLDFPSLVEEIIRISMNKR